MTRIRQLREARGIQCKTLAKMIGATTNTIYCWEAGKCDPSLYFLVRLKVALAVDNIDDLVVWPYYLDEANGMPNNMKELLKIERETRKDKI